MTWYAARTAPGSQLPQREWSTEKTARGYRVTSSLNPDVSMVERALTEAGFVHYMPAEKRLIRHRRKPKVWTPRRFAMIIGYIFVSDVEDWPRLCEVPGIIGVVGTEGRPIPIRIEDILMLRTIEAEADAEFERAVEQMKAMEERMSRRKAKNLFPPGHRVVITRGIASGRTATIVGPARGGRLKMLIDELGAAGTLSVPLDSVKLVA